VTRMQIQHFVIAFITGICSTQSFAEEWIFVPEQSQLEFIASFEGAEAPGQFSQFEVALNFDPQKLDNSSLVVDVDIASADMGNGEINEEIVEQEWFYTSVFPVAQFRSEKIRLLSHSEYIAEGVLTLKGVNQAVSVPFHWSCNGQNAEMTGSVTLSRVDFKIGSGEWASDSSIGHAVQVRFKVVLTSENDS